MSSSTAGDGGHCVEGTDWTFLPSTHGALCAFIHHVRREGEQRSFIKQDKNEWMSAALRAELAAHARNVSRAAHHFAAPIAIGRCAAAGAPCALVPDHVCTWPAVWSWLLVRTLRHSALREAPIFAGSRTATVVADARVGGRRCCCARSARH